MALQPHELEEGQFLLFRAPTIGSLTEMTSYYGELRGFTIDEAVCLNELIAGLDGSGFVHAAIVSSVDGAGEVEIVEQSMPHIKARPLNERCVPYGGQPALVLQLRDPNKRAGAAAAAAERALDGADAPYGSEAMVYQALVLRLRAMVEGDEGRAEEVLEALAALVAEDLGDTCGSLAAEVLAAVGCETTKPATRQHVVFEPRDACDGPTEQAFIKLGAAAQLTPEQAVELATFVRGDGGLEQLLEPLNDLLADLATNPILQKLIDRLYAIAKLAAAGLTSLWTPQDLLLSGDLEVVGELEGWC
ncbi:MAG: hypothetical protein R2733_00190 [Acidimicrobiales bacterium]